jgi:hypothetical protein
VYRSFKWAVSKKLSNGYFVQILCHPMWFEQSWCIFLTAIQHVSTQVDLLQGHILIKHYIYIYTFHIDFASFCEDSAV